MLGTAIGALTLTGSIVAAGKLTGWVTQNPIVFPMRNVVSGILTVLVVAIGVMLVVDPIGNELVFAGLVGVALLLGILLVTRLVPVISLWEIQQSRLITKPVRFLRGHVLLVGKPD